MLKKTIKLFIRNFNIRKKGVIYKISHLTHAMTFISLVFELRRGQRAGKDKQNIYKNKRWCGTCW